MEKPRIVERVAETCAETKRRIGAYIVSELQRFDDNLDVPLNFDEDDYDLPQSPEVPNNIILGEK